MLKEACCSSHQWIINHHLSCWLAFWGFLHPLKNIQSSPTVSNKWEHHFLVTLMPRSGERNWSSAIQKSDEREKNCKLKSWWQDCVTQTYCWSQNLQQSTYNEVYMTEMLGKKNKDSFHKRKEEADDTAYLFWHHKEEDYIVDHQYVLSSHSFFNLF